MNIYSRTPAALAQHFGTLDELSDGRMIIGLGTSGPQVIEHFHGVQFNPPLTRMQRVRRYHQHDHGRTPLNYDGKLFKLKRGFTMRFEPPRKHIPIWIASLNKKSVEFTAQEGRRMAAGDDSARRGSRKRSRISARSRAPPGAIPQSVAVKAPGHVQ